MTITLRNAKPTAAVTLLATRTDTLASAPTANPVSIAMTCPCPTTAKGRAESCPVNAVIPPKGCTFQAGLCGNLRLFGGYSENDAPESLQLYNDSWKFVPFSVAP
jgi:hypothetical protein